MDLLHIFNYSNILDNNCYTGNTCGGLVEGKNGGSTKNIDVLGIKPST